MKPINLALISTAHIHTREFISNITAGTDGRRVHVIWDDLSERGQRYADDCGARFVPDLAAVLADPTVDGFIICAENTRHLPLLEHVLPVGKPVFCEKPIVTTVPEVARVRALVAKHGTTLFAGYYKPFTGALQAAAAAMAAGRLGQVTHVRYRNAHHAAYGRWFDNPDLAWFTKPELAGGGAFMDMGTHAVHLLRTLCGPVRRVWATIGNASGAYPQVDDWGIAHLDFASGVQGTVEASWVQTGGHGGLEIIGAQAAAWGGDGGIETAAPGQPAVKLEPLPDRPRQVDRLVAAIQGRLTPAELTADLDACLDAVAIMDAAYRSAASGQWVDVATVN